MIINVLEYIDRDEINTLRTHNDSLNTQIIQLRGESEPELVAKLADYSTYYSNEIDLRDLRITSLQQELDSIQVYQTIHGENDKICFSRPLVDSIVVDLIQYDKLKEIAALQESILKNRSSVILNQDILISNLGEMNDIHEDYIRKLESSSSNSNNYIAALIIIALTIILTNGYILIKRLAKGLL